MIAVADIAKKYGVSVDELRAIVAEEGVDISPKTKELYGADVQKIERIFLTRTPVEPKKTEPKVKILVIKDEKSSKAGAEKDKPSKEKTKKDVKPAGKSEKRSAKKTEEENLPVPDTEPAIPAAPKIKIFSSLENMEEVKQEKKKIEPVEESKSEEEMNDISSGADHQPASQMEKFKSKVIPLSQVHAQIQKPKSAPNIAAFQPVFSGKNVRKAHHIQSNEVDEEMLRELQNVGPKDQDVDMSRSQAVIDEVEQGIDRDIMREQRKLRAQSDKRSEEKAKDRARLESMMKPREGIVEIPDVITVKEFAEKISVPTSKVIAALIKNGLICTINHKIDYDTAAIIASEFSVTVKKADEDFSSKDLIEGNVQALLRSDDPLQLITRPPIVSIMGHVDHGKTKLLDSIRNANVIATEAGGITQKIGAYQVECKGKKITFLDTPGHEAFAMMRSRGAQLTDIAILVVAADEGVKPQTREAFEHIKDAQVPFIVAITKIDKPEANVDSVKSQIAELGIVPEDWGGETIVAPVSAVTGKGVDHLLEMILLTAEIQDFKANPDRLSAVGVVIESHLDPKFGPLSSILIKSGTLNIGDHIVVGETFGRVKTMMDWKLDKVREAGPSMPVLVVGLEEVPTIGSILQEEKTLDGAKRKALEIKLLHQQLGNTAMTGSSMETIISKIHSGELKTLKIVLKADSKGSLEAIKASLAKIESTEVEASVIASNVGNITENDILMASASGGVVMGFNVDYAATVKKVAERDRVEVRNYQVIYQLIDEVKLILLGLLDPEARETILGELEILAVFLRDKKGLIVGGRVTSGKAMTKCNVRIFHAGELIGECPIASLKRDKDNVSEVAEGYECGVRIDTKLAIEPGDTLQFYRIEQIKREKL